MQTIKMTQKNTTIITKQFKHNDKNENSKKYENLTKPLTTTIKKRLKKQYKTIENY